MVRRGSSVRVRHSALSFCRGFLLHLFGPRGREVHDRYSRPQAALSRQSVAAAAAQSPKAVRRADLERSERVDGAAGLRHTAPYYLGDEGAIGFISGVWIKRRQRQDMDGPRLTIVAHGLSIAYG